MALSFLKQVKASKPTKPLRRLPPPDFDLSKLRRSLEVTQTEMGKRMGLTMRSYQDLEANPAKLRMRHVYLARYAALEIAVERKEPMLAPDHIRTLALDLAYMLKGSKA